MSADHRPTIAIIAAGAMGSGLGRVLAGQGARVVTSLDGRSAASAKRAIEAGMVAVDWEAVAKADVVLSVMPPAAAFGFAETLAPLLRNSGSRPLVADCNAVSPETAKRIGAVVEAAGGTFVDAGIIGLPPTADRRPVIYASGEAAPGLTVLSDFGLDIRLLDGPIGAASALKMSYAGITKGLTALASAMMLAATRAGGAEGLKAELAVSQPALLAWLSRQVPRMYGKAYRWVGEMEEIADFAGEDPAARELYLAAARFYQQMADDVAGPNQATAALTEFFE